MLSERNKALVDRVIPGIYTALLDSHLDALLDAARAEGGAGEGLAAATAYGSGSTAPPEAISPPPPGGVEELVEKLRVPWSRIDGASARKIDTILKQRREAADALLSQARLLEERTRERDEALKDRNAHAAHVLRMARECEDGLAALETIDACWEAYGSPNNRAHLTLPEQIASSLREVETAERLLEEVEGAGDEVIRWFSQWAGKTANQEAALESLSQALSSLRKEKGSARDHAQTTCGSLPAANHAHEVPAAGAVSPGEEA